MRSCFLSRFSFLNLKQCIRQNKKLPRTGASFTMVQITNCWGLLQLNLVWLSLMLKLSGQNSCLSSMLKLSGQNSYPGLDVVFVLSIFIICNVSDSYHWSSASITQVLPQFCWIDFFLILFLGTQLRGAGNPALRWEKETSGEVREPLGGGRRPRVR